MITSVAGRIAIAAVGCGALSFGGVVTAPMASAAEAPAVSCIWNPSANSNVSGKYDGTNVNIRTGPSTSCTAVGEGQPGHTVHIHCYYWVAATATIWDYLTDSTIGRTGWSVGSYVDQGPVGVTPC